MFEIFVLNSIHEKAFLRELETRDTFFSKAFTGFYPNDKIKNGSLISRMNSDQKAF